MAYVRYHPGATINANDDYWIHASPRKWYSFTVFYVGAGTGTVTIKEGVGSQDGDPSATATFKIPTDPTADMAITATGTPKGYDIRPNGNRIVFTVASISGELNINAGVVDNGRS